MVNQEEFSLEKEKLMEKEIEEKRKITDEVKKKIDSEVFYNFLLAVVIMIYMFFINFVKKVIIDNFEREDS